MKIKISFDVSTYIPIIVMSCKVVAWWVNLFELIKIKILKF